MDLNRVLNEVQSLSPDDQLRLIEEVWQGLSKQDSEIELDDDLKALLDRRLDSIESQTTTLLTWEEIEAYSRRKMA